MDRPQATAAEAGKALDALAVLSMQLSCHGDASSDALVLPAKKVHEACRIIDEAVTALKKIMYQADSEGQGPSQSH